MGNLNDDLLWNEVDPDIHTIHGRPLRKQCLGIWSITLYLRVYGLAQWTRNWRSSQREQFETHLLCSKVCSPFCHQTSDSKFEKGTKRKIKRNEGDQNGDEKGEEGNGESASRDGERGK